MLINDFFFIENKQETENELIYSISLNEKHKIYKGHFPNQPIAPGVVLAQIVKELCQNHLNRELKMKSSRNMKFLNVLDPTKNKNVDIKIILKQSENVYSIKANCYYKEKQFFKIDAKYF